MASDRIVDRGYVDTSTLAGIAKASANNAAGYSAARTVENPGPTVNTSNVVAPVSGYSAARDIENPTPNAGGITPDQQTKDAFAQMADQLRQWGLGSLADVYTSLAVKGETAASALNKIKYDTSINPATGKAWNADYAARFAGNAARVAKGLNAMTEGAYLAAEDSYANTLKSYGLGNMLSTDRSANEKMFANYIGNDLDQTEFANRIKVASDSVINADPQVMQTFKTYYGTLTTSDLVAYALAPDETLPKLKQQIAAAQVGTAATEQGLSVDATRANYLAQQMGGYGSLGNVAGMYQNAAEATGRGTTLSNIYNQSGIKYDQTTAENEYLLQSNDAAATRKRLASLERASFSADSGVNPMAGNLASARTVQGKF